MMRAVPMTTDTNTARNKGSLLWGWRAEAAIRTGDSQHMKCQVFFLPSPPEGRGEPEASRPRPRRPALFEERPHPLLCVSAHRVVRHHANGVLIRRRFVQRELFVERPLAE